MSSSPSSRTVVLIPGDGIGPEVIGATRRVLEAAGTGLSFEMAEAGGAVFAKGIKSGVTPDTIEAISKHRVVLKGPLATPIGKGEKSANVTLRKLFETYGNVRPVRELPGVPTVFAGRGVDLVIVRENIEDLYGGIEHMQTPGVAQSLKVVSRKGCEKIVRLAFEVARSEGRSKVTCATKANILKLTEGLLQHTFDEIAPEYPDITAEQMLVDNCAHQLVMSPEQFGVIVMTNMNGDILSDLASGLGGGLGFAPSANLGSGCAIFEAVHGTAPAIAGQDKANPTALLLSAVMMLRYLGLFAQANAVEHAILVTLESGVRTGDLAKGGPSVGTQAFADAIIGNLGKSSAQWAVRTGTPLNFPPAVSPAVRVVPRERQVVGVDVFAEWGGDANGIGRALEAAVDGTPARLVMISNRGTQVYPATGGAETDAVDVWRCRFVQRDGGAMSDAVALDVVQRVAGVAPWVHIEKLQVFDGVDGFTKAQGQA
ncbi:MAG: NADP-dependent isocitrate dehydrogenase [Gemmatimonadaceae bacterium]|nr:NADP-dependent isocitrate dehydrogenase [Gemmatimonadaceae bacterium]